MTEIARNEQIKLVSGELELPQEILTLGFQSEVRQSLTKDLLFSNAKAEKKKEIESPNSRPSRRRILSLQFSTKF